MIDSNSECLAIANHVASYWSLCGRKPEELRHNCQLVEERSNKNVGIRKIDRSLDKVLVEETSRTNRVYLATKKDDDDLDQVTNLSEMQAYFRAMAAHEIWACIQLCACGSLASSVLTASRALGYYYASTNTEGFPYAMGMAHEIQKEFKEKYIKLGVLEED